MGGMLRKLTNRNNKVSWIYMTPGFNAVFDHDVKKFILQQRQFAKIMGTKID